MNISQTKDGVIIIIFVKPNSPKFNIKVDNDEIIVYSTQEPNKGKVNKEILNELTKLFKLQAEIVSGLTSKTKVLLVRGANKTQIENLLENKKASKQAD